MLRTIALLTVLIAAGRGTAQPADDPTPASGGRQAPGSTPDNGSSPASGDRQAPSSSAPGQGPDGPRSPEPTPIRFDATWDNGLFLTSEDKQFRFHAGGTAQIDSVWLVGPQGNFVANGGAANGVGNAAATQLRRAILQIDGTVYGQFDYMIQYDFANASNDNSGVEPPSFGDLSSSPAPLNIWMQVRDIPFLGIVRIGNQKKTIGMTNETSGSNLEFMERPDNQDAFYGPFDSGFALGVSALNWSESERGTWQFGIYRPATNVFGVALNKYSFGGRVTALPYFEDDGEELVHVGFGTFDGELVEDELPRSRRPLLRNGPGFAVPVLVDTTEIPGSQQYTVGPEFAAVYGPLSVQAEWAGQWLTNASPNGQQAGPIFFQGGYVEALYFLTGEHQQYVKRNGAVRPGDSTEQLQHEGRRRLPRHRRLAIRRAFQLLGPDRQDDPGWPGLRLDRRRELVSQPEYENPTQLHCRAPRRPPICCQRLDQRHRHAGVVRFLRGGL